MHLLNHCLCHVIKGSRLLVFKTTFHNLLCTLDKFEIRYADSGRLLRNGSIAIKALAYSKEVSRIIHQVALLVYLFSCLFWINM